MGTRPAPQVAPRVVFDTGVVVSALVFTTGRLAWLREVWRALAVIPLVSRRTAEELVRVLAYPKFKLSVIEREHLLGDYLPYTEVVERDGVTSGVPKCRDPADQMFIELAFTAKADALVTGDNDLLALAGRFRIAIMTPEQWKRKSLL